MSHSLPLSLSLCNLNEVWVNQGVGNEKAFLKEFKEMVLSLYRQYWENNLRTKERYSVYRTFKSSLSLSTYLNKLKHVKARNIWIRLRPDVSPQRTHKLCYHKDVPPVDYFCPVWEMQKLKFTSFFFLQNMQRLENSTYLENTSTSSFKLALLLAITSRFLLIRLAHTS